LSPHRILMNGYWFSSSRSYGGRGMKLTPYFHFLFSTYMTLWRGQGHHPFVTFS
jgi:hypothetical protein